jgi:hypothetical protein
LPGETQHDQAGVLIRRIGSYIGEIEIQGQEDSTLILTDLGQMPVAGANEPLIHRSGLVSGCTQLLGQLHRKVLIDFEPHAAPYAGRGTTRSRAKSAA